ncbi:MAG: hypothetical protein JWP91_1378 [Fibrobacteres bacterium]|nr:hypothetical protein [Fibrobacterota bacterium]
MDIFRSVDRIWIPAALLAGSAVPCRACAICRPLVKAGVYDQAFPEHLMVMLLPVAVLSAVAAAIHFLFDRVRLDPETPGEPPCETDIDAAR